MRSIFSTAGKETSNGLHQQSRTTLQRFNRARSGSTSTVAARSMLGIKLLSMTLRVLAILAFSTAAFAQTPIITAVVNGASYGAQLCPGLEVTIYGSNLGTNTANLSVTVGGVSGYIVPGTAFNSQVSAQLPFNI